MLEVTDQDAVDQKDFGTAYVSIPVQVGPEGAAAALPGHRGHRRSPAGSTGSSTSPRYCHAWLPVGMTLDDVRFETGWQTEADATLSSRRPGRAPAHAARRCRRPLLPRPARRAHRRAWTSRSPSGSNVVGAGDATASGALPPPRLRPISVSGLEEGQSRTVDVAGYLDSPLAAARRARSPPRPWSRAAGSRPRRPDAG